MSTEILYQYFIDKSIELSKLDETNAKYRSMSYKKVAKKINSLPANKIITKEDVDKLDITPYMKSIANNFLQLKSTKSRVKKLSKVPSKVSDKPGKVPDKTSKVSDKPGKVPSTLGKPSKSDKVPSTLGKPGKVPSTPGKPGKPSKSDKIQNNVADNLITQLTGIKGIGEEKAKKLIDLGVRQISDLSDEKYFDLLPKETQVFISYEPIREIPHEHIKLIDTLINKYDKDQVIIVGSYRRKKPISRDIDIMIVSDDVRAISNFAKWLSKKINIIPYSQGDDKASYLIEVVKIIGIKKIYKIDVFRTDIKYKIPMLLYSTGSKEFNIRMRAKAKRLGYLLNQKGLYKDGIMVSLLKTEKDYFDILDMKYLEPEIRI